ncbi:hypothetical protein [Nocardiopsis nanhaiensis]
MHPDQAAQAADYYRAEMERAARMERVARQARKEARADAKERDRADRGSGKKDDRGTDEGAQAERARKPDPVGPG